jgi:hypothetical protein
MAIYNHKKFASWLPALFDGQFHWDFLRPAFNGTKIMPMDFDAVVERRGKMLVFETKEPGKDIDKGQRITLTTQWKTGATIFVLSGKKPEEINGMAVYAGTQYEPSVEVGDKPLQPCDAFDVVYRVRCWFCWASGYPVPSRKDWDNQLWVWDYERNKGAA